MKIHYISDRTYTEDIKNFSDNINIVEFHKFIKNDLKKTIDILSFEKDVEILDFKNTNINYEKDILIIYFCKNLINLDEVYFECERCNFDIKSFYYSKFLNRPYYYNLQKIDQEYIKSLLMTYVYAFCSNYKLKLFAPFDYHKTTQKIKNSVLLESKIYGFDQFIVNHLDELRRTHKLQVISERQYDFCLAFSKQNREDFIKNYLNPVKEKLNTAIHTREENPIGFKQSLQLMLNSSCTIIPQAICQDGVSYSDRFHISLAMECFPFVTKEYDPLNRQIYKEDNGILRIENGEQLVTSLKLLKKKNELKDLIYFLRQKYYINKKDLKDIYGELLK